MQHWWNTYTCTQTALHALGYIHWFPLAPVRRLNLLFHEFNLRIFLPWRDFLLLLVGSYFFGTLTSTFTYMWCRAHSAQKSTLESVSNWYTFGQYFFILLLLLVCSTTARATILWVEPTISGYKYLPLTEHANRRSHIERVPLNSDALGWMVNLCIGANICCISWTYFTIWFAFADGSFVTIHVSISCYHSVFTPYMWTLCTFTLKSTPVIWTKSS